MMRLLERKKKAEKKTEKPEAITSSFKNSSRTKTKWVCKCDIMILILVRYTNM